MDSLIQFLYTLSGFWGIALVALGMLPLLLARLYSRAVDA